MWGCHPIAFAATKYFGYSLDSNRGTDVDVTEDGGTPYIEPVGVIGSQLLEAGSFDEVHVFRYLDLASPGSFKL